MGLQFSIFDAPRRRTVEEDIQLALLALACALTQPDKRVMDDALVGIEGCGLRAAWQAWTKNKPRQGERRGGYMGLGRSQAVFFKLLDGALDPWELEPFEVALIDGSIVIPDGSEMLVGSQAAAYHSKTVACDILWAAKRGWRPYGYSGSRTHQIRLTTEEVFEVWQKLSRGRVGS